MEEFIRDYELQSKPVIIYNAMTEWSANKNWTIEELMKKYAEVKVRRGDMTRLRGDMSAVVRHVSNCHNSVPFHRIVFYFAANSQHYRVNTCLPYMAIALLITDT